VAATAVEAFGAYLRQLRERRGLSLDDVASLSSSFPDPIGKAYLSRCENGKLKIAFSKTIALSRVYEVPPEVLAERMRLDLEVDRLGAPDTTGMDFRAMYKASVRASHEGRHWDAYALARDLRAVSVGSPSIDHVETVEQQELACRLRLSSITLSLDFQSFSRFELDSIPASKVSLYYLAVLHDRRSVHERQAQRHDDALELGDRAIEIATSQGFKKLLGPFYENRAMTLSAMSDYTAAIESQQQAIACYDDSTATVDKIQAYARLGTIYIGARRLRAARSVLDVALRLAREENLRRSQAQCLCLRGDVEWELKREDKAQSDWQKAADLLRGTSELRLKFIANTRLFRVAMCRKDEATLRRLRRRLSRWKAAVPSTLPELQELSQLEVESRPLQ
jgi:tetratricopeptide (TPR) repeat protein